MIRVRKHQRQVASGKTEDVTEHERRARDPRSELMRAETPEWDRPGRQQEPAPDSDLGRMLADMRDWRSRAVEVPPAKPDTSPMGRLLGTDTQEGADKFARLKAYRDAGYGGPLNSDNEIPDPDDPAERPALEALARMSASRQGNSPSPRDNLAALRSAGYRGAVDAQGNPTDRKALFRARYMAAKDAERAKERFCYAKTIPERDAAERDYVAAKDKLKVLPGALDRSLTPDLTRPRRRR